MLGSWEFVIISVVVAGVVWPYFRKRAKRMKEMEAQKRRRSTYRPPEATTVSYEPEEEE